MQIVPHMKLYGMYLDFVVFYFYFECFCLKFGGLVWVYFFLYSE